MKNNTITFEEAKKMIDTLKDCLIIDVREEEEYITGHADGAVLFPLASINAVTAGEIIPSKDTTVLVYCRSGRRSRQACGILEKLGYTKVFDIGSLIGWPYGIVS